MFSGIKPKKTAMVTAKLDPNEKAKLQKTGYNAREAIEYFNMARGKPCENIEIDLHFMKKDLRSAKVNLMQKECEIKELEEKLEKLGGSVKELSQMDKLDEIIEEFVYMYHINPYYEDISVEEAIELAHTGLARKANNLDLYFAYVKEQIMTKFGSFTAKMFNTQR